jgi:hypothetical protein
LTIFRKFEVGLGNFLTFPKFTMVPPFLTLWLSVVPPIAFEQSSLKVIVLMKEIGIVWYGMVWYGMVWYGMVWCSMV